MSSTTFEDRVARIAQKNGTPMIPATAGGVASTFSKFSSKKENLSEQSTKLRENLNAPNRTMRWVALGLGAMLGMISGLLFQQFIGFDKLMSLSFDEHFALAMSHPAYFCAWAAILLGPVLFTLLAIVPAHGLRSLQFAGIYLGTSIGINFATAVQNIVVT